MPSAPLLRCRSTDVTVALTPNPLAYFHRSILCYRIEANTVALLAMNRPKRKAAEEAQARTQEVHRVEQENKLADARSQKRAEHDNMVADEADDADSESEPNLRPTKSRRKGMHRFFESILGTLTHCIEPSAKQTPSTPEDNGVGELSLSNANDLDAHNFPVSCKLSRLNCTQP